MKNAAEPAPVLSDGALIAGASLARRSREIEDLLQALPDRPELERLYDRKVPMRQILQLLGRNVEEGEIRYLSRCADPRAEVRRILERS